LGKLGGLFMPYQLGDVVADVMLTDLEGRSVSLTRYRGQPVVLVFLRHVA
jgi:peroxiredoxin